MTRPRRQSAIGNRQWILLLALLAGCHKTGPLGASGTVEATEAQLGFQAPGRIESIRVREGDAVKTGDTLATLDRSEMRARHSQAVAQLSQARALLAELQSGSRSEERIQAEAAARAANDRLLDAQRDLDRTRRLLDAGAVSQEQYDKSRLQLDVLQSQKSQADQQLQLVQTGPRPERIDAQRAAVAQAEGAIQQLDAAQANAVVIAPFPGVVTVKDREAGETVPAGAPVVTIMNLGDRWVRIYIPEDELGAIHLGDTASISSDTYKSRLYGGRVSFIASQAEFTPRNVQTREERVKLVYAVKVSITRDSAMDLKPGIPADVVLRH